MVSAENHPDCTAKSPTTIPAISDSAVVSIDGVANAASLRPSIPTSKISSCQKIGTAGSSPGSRNVSDGGSQDGFWVSRSQTGVSSSIRSRTKYRVRRR